MHGRGKQDGNDDAADDLEGKNQSRGVSDTNGFGSIHVTCPGPRASAKRYGELSARLPDVVCALSHICTTRAEDRLKRQRVAHGLQGAHSSCFLAPARSQYSIVRDITLEYSPDGNDLKSLDRSLP